MRTNLIYSHDHGAFLHTCPNCGSEFYGRRNQVYCEIKCKSYYGNEIARQRSKRQKIVERQMSMNLSIAKQLLKDEESKVLLESELSQLGFDITGPFYRVWESADSSVYLIGEDHYIVINRNHPDAATLIRGKALRRFGPRLMRTYSK